MKKEILPADLFADGMLTIKEVSEQYGLSASFLYDEMNRGQLGYVKLGGTRRIPRKALFAYFQANFKTGKHDTE